MVEIARNNQTKSKDDQIKITVNNFAQHFIPIFYKAITPEAIVNGFISTGLCPWDREAPDYSKVEYSNNPVNDVAPLQGININGSLEMGVQTGTGIYIYKQTNTVHRTHDYKRFYKPPPLWYWY